MIIVFTKTDVESETPLVEWMQDFEIFQQALRKAEDEAGPDGMGYIGSLVNSMALMLDEFYQHLSAIGVSSVTGRNIPEFFELVDQKVDEYYKIYKPQIEQLKQEKEAKLEAEKKRDLDRLMKDLSIQASEADPRAKTISEDDESEISEGDGFIEPDSE